MLSNHSHPSLRNVPILVDDNGRFYRVGEADVTGAGRTIVIRFETDKATYHGEPGGAHPPGLWAGPRSSSGRQYTLGVPTSELTAQQLMWAPVSADVTLGASLYDGPKVEAGQAFTFPASALSGCDVRFGAVYCDPSFSEVAMRSIEAMDRSVVTSTWRAAGMDKLVLLAVTRRSEGG